MEKKRVALLGPDMLTRNTHKWLRSIFKVFVIDYDLTESELIHFAHLNEINRFIHGGNVILTQETIVTCEPEWLVFVGKDPEPIISHGAIETCRKRNIPVCVTGGGIRAVIKTTYDQVFERSSLVFRAEGRGWPIPFNAKRIVAFETVSVVGAGNIGKELLLMFHGNCAGAVYAGGRGPKDDLEKIGIPYVSIQDAFRAHVVLVTLALTPETETKITRYHLCQINPFGVLICNTRLGVFDIGDLLAFSSERPDVRIIIDASHREVEHLYGRRIREDMTFQGIELTGHSAFRQYFTPREYSQGLRRVFAEKNLA